MLVRVWWLQLFCVQCSSTCGEGVQFRNVSCPLEGLCDKLQKPEDRRRCDAGPCLHWIADSWGQVRYHCTLCPFQRRVRFAFSVGECVTVRIIYTGLHYGDATIDAYLTTPKWPKSEIMSTQRAILSLLHRETPNNITLSPFCMYETWMNEWKII